MFIISVIPIGRIVGSDTLSYYIKDEVTIGMVLECPLKKGSIYGLVIDVSDIREAKQKIRSADYTIRSVRDSTPRKSLYTREYLTSLLDTASYFACTPTRTITELTPKYILTSDFSIKENVKSKILGTGYQNIVEGPFETRIRKIKSLLNETNGVIHIVVPTIMLVKKISEELGPSAPIFSITSKTTPKKITEIISKIGTSDSSVIVSTPQYLTLTQNIVSLIIVEEYSSELYISKGTFTFDIRHFIDKYASLSNILLYKADCIVLENTGSKNEYTGMVQERFIDMTLEKNKKMPWKSAFLEETLKKVKLNKINTFIYVARTGRYPTTACDDCGHVLSCECGSNLVLHKTNKGAPYYKCRSCKVDKEVKKDGEIICQNCGSWRLTPTGIGVQTVAEDLRTEGYTVFEIHSDACKTDKQISDTITAFNLTEGSILVGTSMAQRHLHLKVPLVAIISLDSLLYIPDYKSDFTVLYTLLKLQNISSQYFIVQTRLPRNPIFDWYFKKNIFDWKIKYLHELEVLSYPPFGVFIKISTKFYPDAKTRKIVSSIFGIIDLNWEEYKGEWFIEQKIPKEEWLKNETMHYKLGTLGKSFRVLIS